MVGVLPREYRGAQAGCTQRDDYSIRLWNLNWVRNEGVRGRGMALGSKDCKHRCRRSSRPLGNELE